jgi:Transposase IS4
MLYRSTDPSKKDSDPWWQFAPAIDEFNKHRKDIIIPGNFFIFDESMSAWKPRKDATGGLPNISWIFRKPKPLGTEFKCVTDSTTKLMLHLEIQRGKTGMLSSRHHNTIGPTAACTLRLAEETMESGDRCIADSWFGSVRACTKLGEQGFVSMMNVKTAHRLFPQDVSFL